MEDYGDWIWDEAEYNFFMSLGDIAKLEYMYDYFNLDLDTDGEFSEWDSNPQDGLDEDKPSATSVDVIITDSHFIISCDDSNVVDKTIGMFRMDGFIISFDKQRGDTYYYKYIGKTLPFSPN